MEDVVSHYLASVQRQMETHHRVWSRVVLLGSFSVTVFFSLPFPHFLGRRMSSLSASWGQESELRQDTQIVLHKAQRGRCFFSCNGIPFWSESLPGV